MGIGLTEEHRALAASVRGQAGRDTSHRALAEQGVLGLHLPEEYGGQGYGLLELAVALEVLGERRVPGAYLPTVLASAVLARSPGSKDLLRGLADGSLTAAVALHGTAGGDALLALGSAEAEVFLLPVGDGEWSLFEREDVTAEPFEGVDLDRAMCSIVGFAGTRKRPLGAVPVREVAAVLLGADSCGVERGPWRRPPNMPRCGSSSGGRSGSSRGSSIGWRRRWWRWSRHVPPCGTRPGPWTRRSPPRRPRAVPKSRAR